MVIKSAEYLISSPSINNCPAPDKPEFAFIGRSNVGKSSLINMLVNRQNLAKTSGTPGKTQLINHFIINKEWYLVDLPGYGYAKKAMKQRKQWSKMIEDYLTQRPNLANVFLLIDARHEPQKIDLEFVDSLGEWQLPLCIVFTKADKVKPMALQRNTNLFLDAMRSTWQFLPESFITSSQNKTGRKELLDFIQKIIAVP